MSEHILPPARHETRDIGFRPLVIGAGLMALTLILLAGFVWWMFPGTRTDKVIAGRVPAFPTPQLQTSPSADMARFTAAEMAALNSYGWVDRQAGIVHIPITAAMQQIVQRGIPDWPTQSAGAPAR